MNIKQHNNKVANSLNIVFVDAMERLTSADDKYFRLADCLLGHGVNVNTTCGSTRFPPLHLAVGAENIRMVCRLIDNGADVNMFDHFGNTPLCWAIPRPGTQMLDILLRNGARTSWTDPSGRRVRALNLIKGDDAASRDKKAVLERYIQRDDVKRIKTRALQRHSL